MFSVIFEVRPAEGRKDEYLAHAKELKPILESIDGFIDNERFESRSRPGWVLSHSTWRDEKSVIRWRTQPSHHAIQEKGRAGIFADYHLRVGEITADTHPPDGIPVREQRFDTTETGKSKLCTILELVSAPGRALPASDDELLAALSLDRAAPGLNEAEIYASIYNPGKLLLLASWAEPENAEPFRPRTVAGAGAVAGAQTIRRRAVRIIRDYGLFDRRETPQYFPDIARKNR